MKRFCFLILFLLGFVAIEGKLSPEKKKPFVTNSITGQLGNQLFEVSNALAYAWDYDMEPFFPELNIDTWNVSYNRDRFFFRLSSKKPPRKVKNWFTEEGNCIYKQIPFKKDIYLRGIFFSYKYFHHHRAKLIETFAPSKEATEYLNKKYQWLLDEPNTVSVHVRTMTPEHHRWSPFVGLGYYEKAFSLFPDDSIFVIFSDRINWCKHHFKVFNKNMVFIEGNDHIQDFFLMSKMKDHINANSSFSWWAAYLDENPNTKVIVPKYYYKFAPTFKPFPEDHEDDINLPEWIKVDFDVNGPFPDDIRKYDARSESVDNQ